MSGSGAALIKKIRAKAEVGGGNAVYALASIPAPAPPSPVRPPGMPTDFAVRCSEDGSLS